MENLEGKFKDENINDGKNLHVPIDSIDNTVSVQRLAVNKSGFQGIYLYGRDNNYPSKITEIAKRSPSLMTAIDTQAKFINGLGFDGARPADVMENKSPILNQDGLTAYNFLSFLSKEKSNINIAVHVNYNILGEAVEFTPIPYEFVRKKIRQKGEKFDQLIITNFFHLEEEINLGYGVAFTVENFNIWKDKREEGISLEALQCFKYNNDPVVVREQIELSGGIENYSGQIYYKNNENTIYQRAIHDVVVDAAQFEAEAMLYSLSSIQNGFSASGVLKIPANMESTDEIKAIKAKAANMHGANNASRTIIIPFIPAQPIINQMFESFQLPDIDSMFTNQKEEAKNCIKQKYNIPNALIGMDSEGNFATQRVQEMFDFYNAMTNPIRQNLEIDLNILLSNSIFKNQFKFPIKIDPLTFGPKIETKEVKNEVIN